MLLAFKECQVLCFGQLFGVKDEERFELDLVLQEGIFSSIFL
jgi:hypothetical protein